MADLDVDALCAELDDILDQPASSSTNNKRGSYQSKAQPQLKSVLNTLSSHPSSSSAFAPSKSSSHTNSTAFELSDSSDDEDAVRSNRPPQPTNNATRTQHINSTDSNSQARTKMNSNPATSSFTSTRPNRSAANGHDSDDDLNNLLADMDNVIDQNPSVLKATELNLKAAPSSRASASTTSSGSSSCTSSVSTTMRTKCYPPLLTNGSPTAPKPCTALLCTDCDQRVICVKSSRWKDSVVDYMFFRNHYPNPSKLQPGLDPYPNSAAYACACSWQSVGVETIGSDTLNLNRIRDERTKKEGCSAWDKLKWICTGH